MKYGKLLKRKYESFDKEKFRILFPNNSIQFLTGNFITGLKTYSNYQFTYKLESETLELGNPTDGWAVVNAILVFEAEGINLTMKLGTPMHLTDFVIS